MAFGFATIFVACISNLEMMSAARQTTTIGFQIMVNYSFSRRLSPVCCNPDIVFE